MTPEQILQLDWDKGNGLLPAVVQHAVNGSVLMLGFMNREALRATLDKGQVVFFSRRRSALWLKGETSGNYLNVISAVPDCDNDTILIQAHSRRTGLSQGYAHVLQRGHADRCGQACLPRRARAHHR